MPIREAPTIYPTAEEWEDFEGVIRQAEHAALHTGIVKVVPPASWKAFEGLRRKYAAVNSGTLDFDLPSPVLQNIMGNKGVYKQYNIEKPSITLQAYKALAELPENVAPAMHERELADPVSALHKKFWCSMGTQAMSPRLYAADVSNRSMFDSTAQPWDLRQVDSLLQRSIPPIQGVTCATLFVGMWRTCFAWHTEDYELSALNFHHMGQAKHWLGVPPHSFRRFQNMCAQLFPGQQCEAFLRHKLFLVSPAVLRDYGIPHSMCVQQPGEFVVTLPGAYHCGFNQGFNMAEACNFALASWIPHGLKSRPCKCPDRDTVVIDMRVFTSESPGSTSASLAGEVEKAGGDAQAHVWKEDDVVWAQVPDSPLWPGIISKASTAQQKREMQAHAHRWLFVLFYGPQCQWAVVPPSDILPFPGPEERKKKAMAAAGTLAASPPLL